MALISKPPELSPQERVRQAVLEMGAIQYVPIRDEEGFFIIKSPGSYLEYGQELVYHEAKDSPPWLAKDAPTFKARSIPINFCYILHKYEKNKYGKLMPRISIDDKVDDYLSKYWKQIKKALPGIPLESKFTAEYKIVDESYYGYGGGGGKSHSIEKYTEVDYLVPIRGVIFPKQWKSINDLLRYSGLLKEKRKRRIGKIIEPLKKIVIERYNKNPKLTAKELADILAEEADKKFPNDGEKAASCYRHRSIVWRWTHPKK
jgi:hypothetical protein